MSSSTERLLKIVCTVFCIALIACTIVREGDDNDDNGEVDAGFAVDTHYNDIPVDANIVDAVVFVEVTNASSGLTSGFHSYIHEVEMALMAQGTFIRDLAVAPLYRQQGQRAPLLYGRNAPNNLHSSLEGTLMYYLTDDGDEHLDEQVESPAENPATLGAQLSTETIYNPETGPGEGRSYFREPEDGFVAFHITGSARNCSHGDSACAVDGQTPADYFTETDDDGHAEWLDLPGSGLSPDEIVHVAVATEEGVDYDSFSDDCTGRPDFPTTYLDFLEPSEHEIFYQQFVSELEQRGSAARIADMCNALSSEIDGSALRTANTIHNAIR